MFFILFYQITLVFIITYGMNKQQIPYKL